VKKIRIKFNIQKLKPAFILKFAVSKNRKEWEIVVKRFENRWNFPHVFGAVDREHIHIVHPADIGSYYYKGKLQIYIG
jgi:hypothetical protein